jgi:hypothetical protein
MKIKNYQFGLNEKILSRILINQYNANLPDAFRHRSSGKLRRPIFIDGRINTTNQIKEKEQVLEVERKRIKTKIDRS